MWVIPTDVYHWYKFNEMFQNFILKRVKILCPPHSLHRAQQVSQTANTTQQTAHSIWLSLTYYTETTISYLLSPFAATENIAIISPFFDASFCQQKKLILILFRSGAFLWSIILLKQIQGFNQHTHAPRSVCFGEKDLDVWNEIRVIQLGQARPS